MNFKFYFFYVLFKLRILFSTINSINYFLNYYLFSSFHFSVFRLNGHFLKITMLSIGGKIRHLAVMPPTRMNMFAAATYRPIYKLFHEFQELAFLGRCAAPSIGRFANCFERCNFDWIAVEAILFDSFDPAPSTGRFTNRFDCFQLICLINAI